MRPYLELLIGKNPSVSTKNVRKAHIFGGSGSAVLDTRLLNFRFEESDGDDIERNRKGRKDIVTFTFLDQVPDEPGFVSDTKLIQVNDLLFVRYGWILGDKGQKVTPDLVEREFRIVKIEPRLNSNIATVTITAYDRSADLDRNVVPLVLEASKGDSESAGQLPASKVLSMIAQSAGLELDQSGRTVFVDAEGNNIVSFDTQLAIPRESLASYLKYLAEETGSQFYVENRRMFFGARKLPSRDKIAATIYRGKDGVAFDIKERANLRKVPMLDMTIEQKISTNSLAYKVGHQNKRTADIDLQKTLGNELTQILLIGDEAEDNPRPPFKPSQQLTDYSQAVNVPLAKARDVEIQVQRNSRLEQFFEEPKLFTETEVSSILRHPSPSAREKAGQALLKQKLTDISLKDMTATVKIFGNPLIRHGQFVKIAGNVPSPYRGNWYVQSVEHTIDGNNYFTTLKLLAGSSQNPMFSKAVKDYSKKISQTGRQKGSDIGENKPGMAYGR